MQNKEKLIAKEIIREIDNKIKREYWTNKEIDKLFGRRSAEEIFQSGSACFMNPCLDLTLASAKIFQSKGINYNLIIEEILPTPDFDFNRLHFVLEFKNGGEEHSTMDYKRCNEVEISGGIYQKRKDLPVRKIIKISGENINPKKTIYESLGYKELEELLKTKFNEYSLDKNLSRLKKDNSFERYKSFIETYGTNFIIKEL